MREHKYKVAEHRYKTEYNKLAKAWTRDTSRLKEGSWIQDLIQVLNYVATHYLG